MLCWARALGEFGATVPLAVHLALETGLRAAPECPLVPGPLAKLETSIEVFGNQTVVAVDYFPDVS
ncbi:hypothetical protein Psuf_004950 [Phytohabitans suffuscus]|uniref:Uncharacterized protein n=1 Tax=Phytohabitans suffuscus TaxID=624315 RepID=A0A6F8YAN9_9ACTN|nr:hypothetical protein Psuf_004950 [Phytohabitans suffuscus]